MTFKELLNTKEFIFLDGAMGTMLQKAGVDVTGIPENVNIDNPETVINIHKSYINAGSDIVYANTFGAYSFKLTENKYTLEELVKNGIENAKKACEGTNTLVALDMGATGKMIEPMGDMTFDQAYDYFKEKVIAGKEADLIVVETMSDLYEAKAALLAAKENSDKPVLCTMSFESNMRTFTGCSIASAVLTLQEFGADAIGLNCSVGPKQLKPMLDELTKWCKVPVIIKPNAGLPNDDGGYDVTPEEFGELMKDFSSMGVKIMGGCCGTNPDYIASLVKSVEDMKYAYKPVCTEGYCTPTMTVEKSDDISVGECPKGIDDSQDMLDVAFDQGDEGVDILSIDLNAFTPSSATSCIKEIQSMISTPLNIICENEEILSSTIRAYNGKPMINGK